MIYFIQVGENGLIKIGYSRNPDKRLETIQSNNHEILNPLGKIPGSLQREKEIHDDLKEFRHKGEWFKPTHEVLEYIEAIKQVDYEIVEGVPVAILWRGYRQLTTDPCPFCGERHFYERDSRYEVTCGPDSCEKRELEDGTIIKQSDGCIIRSGVSHYSSVRPIHNNTQLTF